MRRSVGRGGEGRDGPGCLPSHQRTPAGSQPHPKAALLYNHRHECAICRAGDRPVSPWPLTHHIQVEAVLHPGFGLLELLLQLHEVEGVKRIDDGCPTEATCRQRIACVSWGHFHPSHFQLGKSPFLQGPQILGELQGPSHRNSSTTGEDKDGSITLSPCGRKDGGQDGPSRTMVTPWSLSDSVPGSTCTDPCGTHSSQGTAIPAAHASRILLYPVEKCRCSHTVLQRETLQDCEPREDVGKLQTCATDWNIAQGHPHTQVR